MARNPLRERMKSIKREALDAVMGHGETWTTKIVNGQAGVVLDDIPLLLDALGLKIVDKDDHTVPAELARAYETIARAAILGRSLLFSEETRT